MIEWRQRPVEHGGSAHFRGPLPPRPEELPLEQHGIEVRALEARDAAHWALALSHPAHGEAEAVSLRAPLAVPPELLQWDPRLTDAEKEQALLGERGVAVRLRSTSGNVLRDRKRLLRFLAAVAGPHAVAVSDATSQRFWSPAGLADELSHDADVDIDALYTLHLVGDADDAPRWLHSHGLGVIGAWDFDILRPAPELQTVGYDAVRALAFAIVEGRLRPDGEEFTLGHPTGGVRLVDAATFDTRAPADDRALREADEYHTGRRGVVCAPKGRLSFLGRDTPRPTPSLQAPFPDQAVFFFSDEATALMAERARGTYAYLRRVAEEVAALELPVTVKLAYEPAGGDSSAREHLWFEAHALEDDTIEATLMSRPFGPIDLQPGQRGRHSVERLTGWTIFTPVGAIAPHDTRPARTLRERRTEIEEALARHRRGSPS